MNGYIENEKITLTNNKSGYIFIDISAFYFLHTIKSKHYICPSFFKTLLYVVFILYY